MSYVALYRKFRPQTFAQVKGQDHVVRTIRNQVRSGRIGHAYLFTGTRGTGKTSVAKIMAKALNCSDPKDGEPCCECENCRAINAGSFMDVVEMDAASNNGVDDIRNLISETRYTPAKGKYRVFIIDEAHMITKAAFNAFLKTLEEPPSYAVFILATTEPNKLPQTILSRVQRYDFRRIGTDVIKENLRELVVKEERSAQEKALEYIARAGDGSMRDAVSFLDKCLAYSAQGELTYELALEALGAVDTGEFSQLLRCVYKGDAAQALLSIDRAVDSGKDLSQFTADFCGYLRNVLLVSVNPAAAEQITGFSAENMALLKEDAAIADSESIIRYIRILSELLNRIRFSAVKRILVEVEFIKLAKPQMETDYGSLLERIRQLEERPAVIVQQGVQPPPEAEGLKEDAAKTAEAAAFAAEAGFDGSYAKPSEADGVSDTAGEGFDWAQFVQGVTSVPLRVKLKKVKGRRENGNTVIYATSSFVKDAVEKELGQVKLFLEKSGFLGEVIVKEGEMPDDAPEGISEEELFKDIDFDITREDY